MDSTPPAVCYFYSADRKGERPKKHLQEFSGVLHADAYAGYNQLYVNKKIQQQILLKLPANHYVSI